jgi:hypothetical protein
MVGHAVLDKLHRPFVAHLVKEPPNVRVQHPVHPLPMEAHTQRIKRLVRAAPWPEPVREAQEVHLIYFIENGHHGLLNDFVLQCRDAQRALSPVGLRYIDSSRGLGPETRDLIVSPAENAALLRTNARARGNTCGTTRGRARRAVPDDERFAQQLGSPGYHINRSNKLVIEAKQEMQKRGLASPDDADALALTFARAVAPVAPQRPRRPIVHLSPWS